jgi:hypothetical protein
MLSQLFFNHNLGCLIKQLAQFITWPRVGLTLNLDPITCTREEEAKKQVTNSSLEIFFLSHECFIMAYKGKTLWICIVFCFFLVFFYYLVFFSIFYINIMFVKI